MINRITAQIVKICDVQLMLQGNTAGSKLSPVRNKVLLVLSFISLLGELGNEASLFTGN